MFEITAAVKRKLPFRSTFRDWHMENKTNAGMIKTATVTKLFR